LFLCTCFCDGVECFESDASGNHFPLQPFQSIDQTHNDQQLVKDVTDAFQTKVSIHSSTTDPSSPLSIQLLELRSCQENHEDPSDIIESVHLIWKNVCLLWNLDDCPGYGKISERWNGIVSWERSTRKKQVRNDAKLVLATRLCLEQGEIRKTKNILSKKLLPLECLKLLDPLQIWTILLLSEYFRCLLITHSITCYAHLLLCPKECNFESPTSFASLELPSQLIIPSLIRKKKDSSGIAKRLLIHCHKYQISRKIPKVYTPESENDDSNSSSLDDDDDDDSELDLVLQGQLKPIFDSQRPPQTHPRQASRDSRANESRVSNTSLSISGVRSPPIPHPLDDHPFGSGEYFPSLSEYEPNKITKTNGKSLQRDSTPKSNQRSASPAMNQSHSRQHPHQSSPTSFLTPRRTATKRSPSTEGESQSDAQTPLVAFGRMVSKSRSKSPLVSNSSENYLLSSSCLRSLEQDATRNSFDSSSA
jgi:hypothetical protein